MIDTTAVRERHGVSALVGFVTLNEISNGVRVTVSDGNTSRQVDLTPNEAAYLASELYRLALRADEGRTK